MEACYELMPPWAVTGGARSALRALGIDARAALGAYGVFPRIEPGSYAPVVCCVDGHPSLHGKRWGMLPGWSDRLTLAARTAFVDAEAAPERPAYREAFVHRRCLVPATGFLVAPGGEASEGSLLARPVRGRLLCMAGLWNRSGDGVLSYSLLARGIDNDCDPVFIAPDAWASWLTGGADEAWQALAGRATVELRYYPSPHRASMTARMRTGGEYA
ncbi:MAG: hypothetical protein GAK28_00187 [Luteibacter sp.]|uniref:SOS response-associated peptidase family protein n=1 Tax=Luteibacter sp. TaxID=1886636 RepID=UPI0013843157|nr:SOS response-associated peptidase family protein [Luteibacter sp.]KAF1009547.1 MAG: hypothetical protein GAK28_00187 [Luteibacter sp.]